MTSTPGHPGIPLHYHESHEELWYILEGSLSMRIGDEEIVAVPGSAHFVPRGVQHSFWNADAAPCRMVATFTPAGYEGWFRERTALLREGRATPEAMKALGEKYDHVVLERVPSTMTTPAG